MADIIFTWVRIHLDFLMYWGPGGHMGIILEIGLQGDPAWTVDILISALDVNIPTMQSIFFNYYLKYNVA